MAQRLGDILSSINNTEHRIAFAHLLKALLDINIDSWRVGNRHIAPTNGIDSLQFKTDTVISEHKEGQMHWDSDNDTLSIGMIGGDVELQVGQEHLIRVFNHSGDDIPNGAAVYIDSSGDQKPRVSLADADNTNSVPEAVVVGLATELLTKNEQGFITSAGLVRDIDTNHLVEGDPVWLSTTPGEWTKTKPTSPNRGVFIGHCIRKHASLGIILVQIKAIPPILGASDVLSAAPNDGDVLMWSAANGRFELTQLP